MKHTIAIIVMVVALTLLFFSLSARSYDQFEGYDLSNPYPSTNDGWYRVQEERRQDRREFEERFDESNNYNPYREDQRFQIEYDE